jgi:CRP-like cAMP-binding protein
MFELNHSRADARQNHLLAALSDAERALLQRALELVWLSVGQVLYEPGDVPLHCYFPIDGIVSLQYLMRNGSSAQVSMIGNEGLVGIPCFLGDDPMAGRATVQVAGHAYRLSVKTARDEFNRNGSLQRLLLRYAQVRMNLTAQTAVCNALHTVNQRFCRWLLFTLDRMPSDHFTMTQETIANMLGVRREGITLAANQLRSTGVLRYHRGEIVVLDRPQLERRCCECNSTAKSQTDRLFPPLRAITLRHVRGSAPCDFALTAFPASHNVVRRDTLSMTSASISEKTQ